MVCRRCARGFTLLELVIVILLIGIVAALAIPMLMRARMSGNEAAAIATMRAIISAQTDFSAANGGFADTLDTLGAGCPGSSIPFIGGGIDAQDVVRSGYRFAAVAGFGATQGPNDCFGNPTRTTYYASAIPAATTSGRRAFATNATAMVWQNSEGNVPTEPFTATGATFPLGR